MTERISTPARLDAILDSLAQPTRRRIIDFLGDQQLSVMEIVDGVGISQPAASKHLKNLREAGVIVMRPDAQRRLYRISRDAFILLEAWAGSVARASKPSGALFEDISAPTEAAAEQQADTDQPVDAPAPRETPEAPAAESALAEEPTPEEPAELEAPAAHEAERTPAEPVSADPVSAEDAREEEAAQEQTAHEQTAQAQPQTPVVRRARRAARAAAPAPVEETPASEEAQTSEQAPEPEEVPEEQPFEDIAVPHTSAMPVIGPDGVPMQVISSPEEAARYQQFMNEQIAQQRAEREAAEREISEREASLQASVQEPAGQHPAVQERAVAESEQTAHSVAVPNPHGEPATSAEPAEERAQTEQEREEEHSSFFSSLARLTRRRR